MFRIISVILIIGISFLSSSVLADGCKNTGNMTESTFKLDIGCMDPITGATKIEGKGGVDVLTIFLGNIADLLLFTVPIIAVVSFLVAGYFYIFSAGDSEKTNKAKTIIKWNIIAIVVALLSYGIIKLIASLFI